MAASSWPVDVRSYPNPRYLEIYNTTRKSFSGNSKPSIVANLKGFNTSDFTQRHSIGKEGGVPPHHNEKENEKDRNAKPVRIRSPAVSKATKNFMSPTISASSNITASPRMEVLVERNEMIQASASSFSDGKSILSSLNPQEMVEDLNSKPASTGSMDQWAIKAKVVSLSLLLFVILVGCLWTPITDSPFVSSAIDYSAGKESSFTKLYEPAKFETTKFDQLNGDFWLWSNNTAPYFSMVSTVKESNVSFLLFGNFTESVKEMEIEIVQLKEEDNQVTEAYEKGEEASEVTSEFEDAQLIQEAEIIESEQGSQGKPEFEESNISLEDEVVEPHTSEVQQTAEECNLISHETRSSLLAEKEQESQVSQVSEFEPESEELHGDERLISDAEVVAPHINHEVQSIIAVKEQEAQVPQVSEIESDLPQAEELHGENRPISNAEVESSVAVSSEPESSDTEASSENPQRFKELHLSLNQKTSSVNVLGISLLVLILTVAAAFMFAKKPKSPTSSANAIPMDQLLTKKLASMPTASAENTDQEMSSRNWPAEVDKVGESCPSEMSSFQSTTSPSNGIHTSYEIIHSKQVPKSKNDAEFLLETVAGIDVYSKTRPPASPSLASCPEAVDADPSLLPYDPITNYLAPRPQFLYYKPNWRIEKICLRQSKLLEDCFTSESLSDTETSEEIQSEISSSSVDPIEGQNEYVEESEAALEETVQLEPNVSEPGTIEATAVSKSYSFFRFKPISLRLFMLLVGCLWITITDSPCISSVIDSSTGKELRFTKLYEPAELTEVARAIYEGQTRNFKLWSTNMVSNFSKMIPNIKESNELSFMEFGNFTDPQVDLVGNVCLVRENQQNLQWPMKELEIGTVQMKEQGDLATEANGKGEDASHVNPEFEEDAKLIQGLEEIEPDQSEIEQIQEEYHVASYIDIGQVSQGKPELEEANLSLKDEVAKPHNSEVQQTEEESKLISHEAQSILAEKELEDQISQLSELEPKAEELQGEEKTISNAEVEELQSEEKPISDAEVKPEAEELQVEEKPISGAEVEPEAEELQGEEKPDAKVEPETEELQGEEKPIWDAEIEQLQDVEKPSSDAGVAASHIDHEVESLITEKEQEAQVPQVSEIKSVAPKPEKLPCEDKLISNAKVEFCGVASEPKCSESEALIENSQSFKELYLSLEEKSSVVRGKPISDAEVRTEAEKLQGEEKQISDAEVEELLGEEKLISVAEVRPETEELQGEEKLSFDAEADVPQVFEIKSELPQHEKLPSEDKVILNAKVEPSGAVSEPKCSESEALTENSLSFKELYPSLKEKSSVAKVLGISLLILVLTVTAAFIYRKQQKSPSPSAAAIPIDQFLAKKLFSVATASIDNTHQETLSSRNWPKEVVAQPCPSEMSSFQRTASYQKKGSKGASSASEHSMVSPSYSKKESKGASEAQSQEMRLRKSNKRESLTSSSEYSMGSTSYGCYTSYEKISHKHGCRSQEVVIPVRRSCRIRNQASSS